MPQICRTRGAIAAVLAVSSACASPAAAQEEPSQDEAVEVAEVPVAPSDRGSKKPQIIFAPVPFPSPSSGTGLAAGAVAFYNPNDTPHQWITGGGLVWTSRGTKGLAAFHKMASTSDRFRLNATASLLDQENHFFGIG